ncbi:MAG: hypothetical protein ALECFALPRED_004074 [Alectoria fallacina]|uniref:Uncharacterized protein n=1 Tax=Alectoria fallacina TaxID=1903189 RepID=A0A8H3IUI8_9LECA|nr:MAG: hypothetical protein ALECFALPRED_004074 [Alectoria fallacina]
MNLKALAFTEMCCKFGKDKVCTETGSRQRVFIEATVDHSLWHYCLLPSPVYDPLVWSEDDKQEWLRRRHEGVEFVAYPDELSRRATICILPHAYAGRIGELQKDGEFQQVQGGLGLMSWSKINMQHLQRFGFPSEEAVIQRWWEMYFDGKIGAPELFKDLIISFIGVHSEGVKLRDGSARYG